MSNIIQKHCSNTGGLQGGLFGTAAILIAVSSLSYPIIEPENYTNINLEKAFHKIINPSQPELNLNNAFLNQPVFSKNMLDGYNQFLSTFLSNATDMDAELANYIQENYINLLAK